MSFVQHPGCNEVFDRPFYTTLLLCSVLLLGHVCMPFNLDNDVFQAMGLQLVKFGRLPYIGSFDQNFPGMVLVHAGIIEVFGNSAVAFRIVDTLWHVVGALLIYLFVRRLFSKRAALYAAVLSCIYYNFGGYWISGQKDGLAFLLILVATAIYYRYRDRTPTHGSGIPGIALFGIASLIALSTLIRPTNIVYGFVLGWYIARTTNVSYARILFAGTGCLLIVWLLALWPLLFSVGGIDRFITATVTFNTDVYGTSMYRLPLASALLKPQELLVNAILLATIITVWRAKRIGRPLRNWDAPLWIGYYVAARAPIVLMGKYLGYHYEPVAILSMAALGVILWHWTEPATSLRYLAAGLVLVAAIVTYPWHAIRATTSTIPVESTEGLERVYRDDLAITSYLLRPENREGRIEAVGIMPAVYWRTEREPASAFTVITPLAMPAPVRPLPFQRQWNAEFVDSIRTVRPRFLLLSNSSYCVGRFFPLTPAAYVRTLPGFAELLATSYKSDTTIGDWQIFRRK